MAKDNVHAEKHRSTWPEQRCIANHPELDVGQREDYECGTRIEFLN